MSFLSSLKNVFGKSSRDATREALTELKTSFIVESDGTLVVPNDLYLSGTGLTAFPDLTNVIVKGSVYAEGCNLKTLKGAPQVIGRNFFCDDNDLENLDFAPRHVGLIFDCQKNPRLKAADGAPQAFGTFISDFAKYASPVALADAVEKQRREDATTLKHATRAMKRISLKPVTA